MTELKPEHIELSDSLGLVRPHNVEHAIGALRFVEMLAAGVAFDPPLVDQRIVTPTIERT